jgi:SAM-dependent methyltransferase
MVLDRDALGWEWLGERIGKVAPFIIGDTVLDIGCGLGIIADYIDGREYLGLDFANFPIKWANNNIKNKRASFQMANIEDFTLYSSYDTVLLLEVLEHVADIEGVAQLAKYYANKRVIVTVPRDMPGKGHVTPTWDDQDLKDLFGTEMGSVLFGGPNDDRWWLGIRDY